MLIYEYDNVTPETPDVVSNEVVNVYVPVTSYTQKGIAKFNSNDFKIDSDGEVKIDGKFLTQEDIASTTGDDSLKVMSQEATTKEINRLDEDILAAKNDAISEANTYTDGKISDVNARIDTKVSKVTPGTMPKVYTMMPDGVEMGFPATFNKDATTFVYRDVNGRAKFADPSDVYDASNKNYVDTKVSESESLLKTYTDTKVSDLKTYADNKTDAAKAEMASYTDVAVAGIVNSAPSTLDTLKELSKALGDDPNFATTVATELGKKAVKTEVDAALETKLDKSNVAQTTGQSTTAVMSQKAVTHEINAVKSDLVDFKTNQPNLFMRRGANILDESLLVDGKRLNSNGVISDLASTCVTESFIDISDIKDSHMGAYYTTADGKPLRCFYRLSFYSVADVSGHLKTYDGGGSADMSKAICEIPNGANFVRVSYSTLTTSAYHFMLISGNSDMELINYEKRYEKITVVPNGLNEKLEDFAEFKEAQPNIFPTIGINVLNESLLIDGKRLSSDGKIIDLVSACAEYEFISLRKIKSKYLAAYAIVPNTNTLRCFYRISFYSTDNDTGHILTYTGSGTNYFVEIPNNAKYVRVSYPLLTTSNFKFMLIEADSTDIELPGYEEYHIDIVTIPKDLLERLDRVDNICGVARFKDSNDPSFPIKYGDVTAVLSHFKLGMVKDGKLMYWVNQADIYKQEDGLYDSVLSGEDGDILSVNDCDIYYLITGDDTYDIMLYSLTPFVFDGIQSNHIRPRGVAPCACYIDNINNADERNNFYEILADGKSHCTISNNEAYTGGMKYIKGIYDESGIYNASDSLISDGINMPTVFANLRVAEKAAMNKGDSYTNYDMLSIEIMLSMMFAEYGTRYVGSKELFGICNSNDSNTNEALFTDGDSDAIDGMRFKDENNQWVYMNYTKDYSGDIGNLTTSNGAKISIITMPTNYTSPWKMLEQHSVMSYAYRNNIEAGVWFYYCGREYKYKNVGNGNFIRDGIMSCVISKKFRTKLDGVFHNSVDISGNDAEFIIISSLYRGVVLDTLPHYWLTGIKAVLCSDKPLHYFFYGTRNHKKYLVDRTYEAKTLDEVYDFEKAYNYLGEFYSTGGTTEMKLHDKSILIPTVRGGDGKSTYDCLAVQTDKKVANSDINNSHFIDDITENTKIVTGVKWGYLGGLNKLFIQHPESYKSALAGYTKFVCQEVEI